MIRGERVHLKLFDLGDLQFLHKWNNDPEYVGEFEPFEPVTEEELREWLPKNQTNKHWYIIQIKDGEKVGQLVVTEKRSSKVQVGYRVATPYRNMGYCTEAVKTLLHYLFNETYTEVVLAEVNPQNTASIRVLEKTGFVKTGYKERGVKFGRRWLDGYIYEIKRGRVL